MGIAKEDYYKQDDVRRVFGEMDYDPNGPYAEFAALDAIALEAYSHGATRVILTKHKAYAVTSVEDEMPEPEEPSGVIP